MASDIEKEILLRIKADSNLGPQLGQDADALKNLGEKMSEATDGVHKFRGAVDDTVEQLNIFGDRGSALVGEINKISDPLKRLELANKALASSSFQSGGALGQLNSKFQEAKVKAAIAVGGVENLALITGVATAGVAALAAVVGGALVAAFSYASSSFTAYLEKQREIAKGSDDNAQKARELIRSFDDLKKSTDALEQSSGKLVASLTGASRLAGAQAINIAKLDGAVSRLADSEEQFNTVLGATAAIFPQYTPLLLSVKKNVDLNTVSYKSTTKAADQLTFTFKTQADAAKILELSLKGVSSQLDEVARKSQSATPYLDAITGFKGSKESSGLARDPLGKGSGGGEKKQNQIAIDFSDTAKTTLSELFNGLANKVGGSIVGIGLALSGARDTNTNNIASSQQSQTNNVSSAIGAASSQVGKGLETGFTQANTEAEALKNQTDALYGSFLNLGVGITDAFLAFSVGASSGQQVLSGILSNVGTLATQLGTFFILLGGAESSSGFLGLQGGAAIAAGASLLAFGSGLKAGAAAAGASGAKEARNRRSSIIKAPSANNLPQAQNSNITVILEVEGDRFVRTLAPNITRQARNGAVRIPATSIIPN